MEPVFTQFLMKRGFLSSDDSKDFLTRITRKQISDDDLENLRIGINSHLEFADLVIKRIDNPVDGKRYLAFVNIIQDDSTTHISLHHPSVQPEFFKHIVSHKITLANHKIDQMTAILHSEVAAEYGGCLPETDLLKIGRGTFSGIDQKLSISPLECTQAIEGFLREGWLQKMPAGSHEGHICLGARAFMELDSTILSMDLPEATRAALESFL